MSKTTLCVTFAALALVGACGKKDKEPAKRPPPVAAKPPEPVAAKPPEPPPPPPKPVPLVGADLGKRFVECHAAWSASDSAKLKGCYAAAATSRFVDSMMPETKGADAIVANAMDFHGGFPDAVTAPQLVLVNGRNVASVLLFTGTNSAPMKSPAGAMPATNKRVGLFMLNMATFDDANQITEDWWVMDDGTFGAQLGISPPMGRPVADKGMDGAPNIVVATDSDVEKANLAALQVGNDAFNKRDLKAMAATWAADVIESDQGSPADTVGTKAVTATSKMFLTAFPDGKSNSLKTWAAGDYAVSIASFNGTNTGPMGPMKKTGKPVAMTVAEIVKMDGAKVKQMWRFYNSHAMAIQLGWAPDPSKAVPGAGPPATK